MFERFKLTKKLWTASKAATRVTSLLTAILLPVSAADGTVDLRLKSDDFVVGYIYGVILACELEGDEEEKGFFIMQVFEQLFPKHGKSVTEFCNEQAAQKNPDFKRAIRLGYTEMLELADSGSRDTLPSLVDHVCRHYLRYDE